MVGFKEQEINLSVPRTGNIRTTLSILTYHSKLVDHVLVVPVGLKTDLGSIPKALQGIFPKDGKAMFGYILHDNLYKNGDLPRNTCDNILEEAMKTLGVSWWRRKAVRAGLQVGGWCAWNQHRKGKGIH